MNKEVNWHDLIGKRALVRRKPYFEVIEVKILEISPSGEYIKLEYLTGHKSWESIHSLELIEPLD